MSCTTIIAGKKASETGYVLAAHNEDDNGRFVLFHGLLPERDWDLSDPEQAFLPAEEGLAKIPQVGHTFASYWAENVSPEGGASNSDMFYNQNGVLFTSNFGHFTKPDENDPSLVKDGGIAFNLRRAVAERAMNARHGVQVALSLLAEWGYAPCARNYFIADKDEAWSVQAVRGFIWAAARIPDNAAMVLPNHLSIHSLTEFPVSLALDPQHPEVPQDDDFSQGAILYPADLISRAIENGWYTPSDPEKTDDFDFAFAYQKERSWKIPHNINRHLNGMRVIMGDQNLRCPADSYAEAHHDPNPDFYPFCVYPKDPVTLEKLAEILSSHVPLTPESKAELGPGKSPHLRRGLILCYGGANEAAMIQFAGSNEQTTLWTSFGRSCQLPFLPLHPLNGIPEILEPMEDPSGTMARHLRCAPERTCWRENAWWKFRDFQELAEMQVCDIEEKLHDYRFDYLKQSKEANFRVIGQNGSLRDFENERIAAALDKWKEFADRYFNQAEIMPLEPVPLNDRRESFEIRFRLPDGQTPAEESLILAQGMSTLPIEAAPAVPGSLIREDDGTWKVLFPPEQIMNKAYARGKFDYYLGGTNTAGRTFAGQVILTFI